MPLTLPRRAPSAERPPVLLGTRLQRTAIAGLVVLSFGAGLGVDRLGGVTASSSLADADGYGTLQDTWDLIQNNYVAIDDVKERDLMEGAARGMVDALGDTGHSTYLSPDEAGLLDADTQGEYVGLGIQFDFESGQPIIVTTLDNSPAQAAGLLSGDVITSIDGEATESLGQDEVSNRLSGAEGESVQLGVSRPSTGEELTVSVTRAKIKIVPVTWRMLPDGVAQIRLSQFTAGSTKAVQKAIRAAEAAGATSVVFDLRDNPGGLVFEEIGVASQFLPEGTTLFLNQEKGKDPLAIKAVPGGIATDIPLVVLINGGSASAAEIAAAGLHDNKRAELVGTKTFGTGTVLTPYTLDDGSAVVLGTALWLDPDGDSAWHTGVAPDEEVDLAAGVQISRPSEDEELTTKELIATDDAQLIAGYETLTGEKLAKG